MPLPSKVDILKLAGILFINVFTIAYFSAVWAYQVAQNNLTLYLAAAALVGVLFFIATSYYSLNHYWRKFGRVMFFASRANTVHDYTESLLVHTEIIDTNLVDQIYNHASMYLGEPPARFVAPGYEQYSRHNKRWTKAEEYLIVELMTENPDFAENWKHPSAELFTFIEEEFGRHWQSVATKIREMRRKELL